MKITKLFLLVLLLCSYGYWREVHLTRVLEQGRAYVIDRSLFKVSIVEIIQQSPIQTLCIAKLVDANGSMLAKVPGSNTVHLGDILELTGKVDTNRDSKLAGFYRLKEIVAELSVTDAVFISSTSSLSSIFYYFRNALTQMLQNTLNYNSAGLLAGVLWGDTSHLPKTIKSDFRATGLTHVMAVSGANMTLLAQMLSYLLFFLPIRTKYTVIILAMIFFCGLVGMSAAVLRAGIMALISALAVIVGKKYWAVGAFNLVVLLMFLYKPAIVFYDVGFQLSCSATLGLIFLQPFLLKLFKLIPWKYIRETIATTLAASIVTIPITLHYFAIWYPLSIVINIVFLPIIGFFSMVFYLASPLLLLPFVGSVISTLINLAVLALLWLLDCLSLFSSRVVIVGEFSLTMLFFFYSVVTFMLSIRGRGGIISRVNKDLGKLD